MILERTINSTIIKIPRPNPTSDPRLGKDADDYLGGQPEPLPGARTKRVARRPHQSDQSAQVAQRKLTQELDSQAFLLARNAERPLTAQGQASFAKRKTTSEAHAAVAKTTADLLLLCPESVAAVADAARVAPSLRRARLQEMPQACRRSAHACGATPAASRVNVQAATRSSSTTRGS